MQKYSKLVICSLTLALALWACAGESYTPETPDETTQTQQETVSAQHNYTLTEYEFVVYDHSGNVILRGGNDTKDMWFTAVDANLLRLDATAGPNAIDARFFDLEQGIYSPLYRNVIAGGHGLVFLNEWTCGDWPPTGEHLLVISDMFDPQLRHKVLEFDFWQFNGEELPPEVLEQLLPGTLFRSAEFLSLTQLHVEYLNADAEFITQTIDL